jgi:hypothetical protein
MVLACALAAQSLAALNLPFDGPTTQHTVIRQSPQCCEQKTIYNYTFDISANFERM